MGTKRLKYTLLKSLLLECEDYYEEEYNVSFNFPNVVKWKSARWHKEPESNADVFLTIEEVKQILDYIKYRNYKYYIIFRLFAESGLRKGGMINLNYDKVDLRGRVLRTMEKNGRVVYYLTPKLVKHLEIYIKERKLINVNTKALFLSTQLKRYSLRQFNSYLKAVIAKLDLGKNVTCQVWRRSLNNFREEMGCDNEKRSILLNQAVEGVNFNNYVKKDYEKFLRYFDTWDPFNNAGIQL